MGFGASRVQGTPKPARGSAGPPVSHPKKAVQEQLPLPRAVGRSSLHITAPAHSQGLGSILLGQRQGVPGLSNPHQRLSLKISGATRWLGHRGQTTAGQQDGTRTVFGGTGQRTLFRSQGSALIPPGPSQFSSSPTVGLLLYIAHGEGPSGPQSYS